jgi:hypothetical protein
MNRFLKALYLVLRLVFDKGLSHKKFNFLSISNKLLKLSAKSSSCAFLLRHFVSLKTFVTNVRIPARIRFEFFF